MECPNCGAANFDGASFCSLCLTSFASAAPADGGVAAEQAEPVRGAQLEQEEAGTVAATGSEGPPVAPTQVPASIRVVLPPRTIRLTAEQAPRYESATYAFEMGCRLYRESETAEAAGCFKTSVTQMERAFGHTSEELLPPLENLVTVLCQIGEWDEASAYAEHVVAVQEASASPVSPTMGGPLLRLAGIRTCQARFEDAEDLERRVLGIYERVYGPEHDLTGTALAAVGATLLSLGRLEEAVPLLERAARIKERSRGFEDPATQNALADLARCRKGPDLAQERSTSGSAMDDQSPVKRDTTADTEDENRR